MGPQEVNVGLNSISNEMNIDHGPTIHVLMTHNKELITTMVNMLSDFNDFSLESKLFSVLVYIERFCIVFGPRRFYFGHTFKVSY